MVGESLKNSSPEPLPFSTQICSLELLTLLSSLVSSIYLCLTALAQMQLLLEHREPMMLVR